jgi:hypothetical protein
MQILWLQKQKLQNKLAKKVFNLSFQLLKNGKLKPCY